MVKHFRVLSLIAAAAFAIVGWVGQAQAAFPSTITQQGRLLDTTGAGVTGDTPFVFSIYNVDTGGTALWTESKTITLDDGYFSTQLGSDTAFDANLFDGTTLYLGIKVGNDPEMTPRQPIVAVPYAFHAALADDATHATNADAATSATNADHATTADNATGDITPTSVTINGNTLLDSNGNIIFTGAHVTGFGSLFSTNSSSGTSTATANCDANQALAGGGCSVTGSGAYMTYSDASAAKGGAPGWTCSCAGATCTAAASVYCVPQ